MAQINSTFVPDSTLFLKDVLEQLVIDNVVKRNLDLIPEYGRWDDLFALFGTPLQEDALKLIKTQIAKDMKSEAPSLLAKWILTRGKALAKTYKAPKADKSGKSPY